MISVHEADRHIRETVQPGAVVSAPLGSLRCDVLRESITADRPFPPFHRVAMDGIAIRHSEWVNGRRSFRICLTQAAGAPATSVSDPASCAEVMTGAVLPDGVDCVIPVEALDIKDNHATIREPLDLSPMDNVHTRGIDGAKGKELLREGTLMLPPQIAVAATVGKAQVRVTRQPRIALVTTGDELVPVGIQPEPHQIRRSNAHAIATSLHAVGIHDISDHHFSDSAETIRTGLESLLGSHDLVILSGGVSAGKFDHVPETLSALGVQQIFHKVALRPGKPLLFGSGPDGQIVFGLPGNPVSALVCTYRFVIPAILRHLGAHLVSPGDLPQARLASDVTFKKPLTLFQPIRVEHRDDGHTYAAPVSLSGSGDLVGLCRSDGVLELPHEPDHFRKGSPYPLWLWDNPLSIIKHP